MKNIPALNTCTTDALHETRRQLYNVWAHSETPDHIQDAAAVLINFYGAEIDARMAEKGRASLCGRCDEVVSEGMRFHHHKYCLGGNE